MLYASFDDSDEPILLNGRYRSRDWRSKPKEYGLQSFDNHAFLSTNVTDRCRRT